MLHACHILHDNKFWAINFTFNKQFTTATNSNLTFSYKQRQEEEDKKRNSDDSLVALTFDFIKKTIDGLISIWWLDRNPEGGEGGKTVVGGVNPKHFKGNPPTFQLQAGKRNSS